MNYYITIMLWSLSTIFHTSSCVCGKTDFLPHHSKIWIIYHAFVATLYGIDGRMSCDSTFIFIYASSVCSYNIKYTNLQRSEFIAFRFSGLFSSTFTTYSRGLVTFRVLKSQVSELLFRFIIAALIDLK